MSDEIYGNFDYLVYEIWPIKGSNTRREWVVTLIEDGRSTGRIILSETAFAAGPSSPEFECAVLSTTGKLPVRKEKDEWNAMKVKAFRRLKSY